MNLDIAFVMLAAGASKRFGSDNKLLSNLGGKPLACHSAEFLRSLPRDRRLAVIPKNAPTLAELYKSTGWTVLENSNSKSGQASSLKIGVNAAVKSGARGVTICLADMPFVDEKHIIKIISLLAQTDAVMSSINGVLMPPAAFGQNCFGKLLKLHGDRGAKSVFASAEMKATVAFDELQSIDIDTSEDLAAGRVEVH